MQKGHRTSEAVRLNGGDNGHAGLELRARYGARFEERPLACCEICLRAPCGLDRRRQRRLASRAGLWGTERVGAVVSTCMQGWPPSREQCVPQAPRASPSPWCPRRAVGNDEWRVSGGWLVGFGGG